MDITSPRQQGSIYPIKSLNSYTVAGIYFGSYILKSTCWCNDEVRTYSTSTASDYRNGVSDDNDNDCQIKCQQLIIVDDTLDDGIKRH